MVIFVHSRSAPRLTVGNVCTIFINDSSVDEREDARMVLSFVFGGHSKTFVVSLLSPLVFTTHFMTGPRLRINVANLNIAVPSKIFWTFHNFHIVDLKVPCCSHFRSKIFIFKISDIALHNRCFDYRLLGSSIVNFINF